MKATRLFIRGVPQEVCRGIAKLAKRNKRTPNQQALILLQQALDADETFHNRLRIREPQDWTL